MMQYDITNSQILIFSVIDTSLDNVLKSLLNLGVTKYAQGQNLSHTQHLRKWPVIRKIGSLLRARLYVMVIWTVQKRSDAKRTLQGGIRGDDTTESMQPLTVRREISHGLSSGYSYLVYNS
jgi:hypothetical protein